jgi:hypothetical protein
MAECNKCSRPRLSCSEFCHEHQPKTEKDIMKEFQINFIIDQYRKACIEVGYAEALIEENPSTGNQIKLNNALKKEENQRKALFLNLAKNKG